MASNTSGHDYIDTKIKDKKKWIEDTFKLMYESDAKREEKKDVLNTVLEQVEVCEGLLCPAELETIMNWLRNKTVCEIEMESRRLKFPSVPKRKVS